MRDEPLLSESLDRAALDRAAAQDLDQNTGGASGNTEDTTTDNRSVRGTAWRHFSALPAPGQRDFNLDPSARGLTRCGPGDAAPPDDFFTARPNTRGLHPGAPEATIVIRATPEPGLPDSQVYAGAV
jgi:hypothetical protein